MIVSNTGCHKENVLAQTLHQFALRLPIVRQKSRHNVLYQYKLFMQNISWGKTLSQSTFISKTRQRQNN